MSNVERIDEYVTTTELAHVEERRTDWQRRATDRMDSLELAQRRTDEVVRGRDGGNGLAGDVRILKHTMSGVQKFLWLLAGVSLTTAVNAVVDALR